MKGLELSRHYFEYGRDLIMNAVPGEVAERMAAGLVGEGSQCFGFDDEISQDHDFAPGFCIWLTEDDYLKYGNVLQKVYDTLPAQFMGYSRNNITARDRLGVFPVKSFYEKFLGSSVPPESNMDWLLVSEANLAACTNGEVFYDPSGCFSEIRLHLLNFYPEDVLRKKIAARAAVMSQSGQYNLLRTIRRHDIVASGLAAARFTDAALSMLYLLNRRYMPFYKWAYHGSKSLQKLQNCLALLPALSDITVLAASGDWNSAYNAAFNTTEMICSDVARELKMQGFSSSESTFLQDHLPDIMSGIRDPQIASMHPMMDFNF